MGIRSRKLPIWDGIWNDFERRAGGAGGRHEGAAKNGGQKFCISLFYVGINTHIFTLNRFLGLGAQSRPRRLCKPIGASLQTHNTPLLSTSKAHKFLLE